MSGIPAKNIASKSAAFKAGNTSAKTSIKKATVAKSTQASSNTSNNNSGEVAKSEQAAAETYAHSLPGTAKSAKKVAKSSRSQEILNQIENPTANNGLSSPSAFGIRPSDSLAAANDTAAFQAMIKGSEAVGKVLMDGFKAIGTAAGTLGSALAQKAKADKNQGGGGAQSSNQQAQQQQQASQQQFAQTDNAAAQGGNVA